MYHSTGVERQRGEKLVSVVEKEVENWRKILVTGNKKRERVLVSGMIDKETGKMSKLFTSFTTKEIRNKRNVEFIKGLHPNLKKRLKEHLERKKTGVKGFNLEDPDVLKYGWKGIDIDEIVPHAEFMALDDLLKQISKNELPDLVFERILGYNSYLQKEGIMHTCLDCFYLTDLITFIK